MPFSRFYNIVIIQKIQNSRMTTLNPENEHIEGEIWSEGERFSLARKRLEAYHVISL